MRICISHETHYRYASPARSAIQLLRLTPRSYEGQRVLFWRIDVEPSRRLRESEDYLGNVTHMFDVDGPFQSMTIRADGEIDVEDVSGVVRGAVETFPPGLFLRDTALTLVSPEIRQFGASFAKSHGSDRLALLHAVTQTIYGVMTFSVGATDAGVAAATAFSLKRGVCQDFAHIFIAVARSLGIPARYVSGYLARSDGVLNQEAGHAWAEAYVEGLGWVGFDPANGVSPTDAYARVAIGLDYLGAAPILGARKGGGVEELGVSVKVGDQRLQSQS